MPVNHETFIQDLQNFFKDTIDWCAQESERESANILSTLQAVMEDVKRRSKMSASAELAFKQAESRLSEMRSAQHLNTEDALQELQALQSDNMEVSKLMNPVIEALQFQDQFAKNLLGINSTIKTWFEWTREHPPSEASAEEVNDLVAKLTANLSSPTERNIVRRHFDRTDLEETLADSDQGYI